MPCYEPPSNEPIISVWQTQRYVATLTEIEELCRLVVQSPSAVAGQSYAEADLAQSILDIIDNHWGKKDQNE